MLSSWFAESLQFPQLSFAVGCTLSFGCGGAIICRWIAPRMAEPAAASDNCTATTQEGGITGGAVARKGEEDEGVPWAAGCGGDHSSAYERQVACLAPFWPLRLCVSARSCACCWQASYTAGTRSASNNRRHRRHIGHSRVEGSSGSNNNVAQRNAWLSRKWDLRRCRARTSGWCVCSPLQRRAIITSPISGQTC